MGRKRERIDVSGDGAPLTDNPFAALGERLPKDLPERPAEKAPAAEILPPKGLDYRVEKTRKGAWDIAFERRAGGKGVTLLRRVHGDGEALLKALKKRCGAGGAFREETVELQGDHRGTLADHLQDLGL